MTGKGKRASPCVRCDHDHQHPPDDCPLLEMSPNERTATAEYRRRIKDLEKQISKIEKQIAERKEKIVLLKESKGKLRVEL